MASKTCFFALVMIGCGWIGTGCTSSGQESSTQTVAETTERISELATTTTSSTTTTADPTADFTPDQRDAFNRMFAPPPTTTADPTADFTPDQRDAFNRMFAPPPTTTAAPPPPTTPAPLPLAPSSCDPNYSGCVPIASDVDCAGGSGNGPAYTGYTTVIGSDIYDLDSDGDGQACE